MLQAEDPLNEYYGATQGVRVLLPSHELPSFVIVSIVVQCLPAVHIKHDAPDR